MVIKESMRLYPPAWILGRELISDCKIGDRNFPRGTVIYFSQWAVHRDTRFFKDPEQFNPDRWADNLEQRLPRRAYFPFGAGARVMYWQSFFDDGDDTNSDYDFPKVSSDSRTRTYN